jgi:hypothetical protein
MMDHITAEQLLHRYFEGNTTLEEEARLREYFRGDDVHPDLKAYDPMFTYWEEAATITAPPIRRGEAVRRRLPLRWLTTVAAACLLLLTVNHWTDTEPKLTGFPIAAAKTIDWSKYEVTDPEEAYLVLREALKTASTELNRGPRITVRELGEIKKVLK